MNNNIREIVTKAVVSKGKKIIRLNNIIVPNNDSFSILGCWVINHEFEGKFAPNSLDSVNVNGVFEINIWYSYDNNHKTDIARMISDYSNTIKLHKVITDTDDDLDIIVKVSKLPTVVNASIVEDGMSVDVNLELTVEVIGETKILINTCQMIENNIEEEDIENEINENFIQENIS